MQLDQMTIVSIVSYGDWSKQPYQMVWGQQTNSNDFIVEVHSILL
jgi:hypothetical protein